MRVLVCRLHRADATASKRVYDLRFLFARGGDRICSVRAREVCSHHGSLAPKLRLTAYTWAGTSA
jgi:hypothetical protein